MIEIKNEVIGAGGDSAKIFVSGDICTESVNELNRDIEICKNAGIKSITFIINSPGGSVSDGLAMYDIVASLTDIETIAEIQGICASAATYLPVACDKILINANSDILCHEPEAGFYGTLKNATNDLEQFATLRDRIIALYCSRTGLTPAEVEDLLAEAKFLDAKRCKELNLVDEIIGETPESEPEKEEEKPETEPETEPETPEAEPEKEDDKPHNGIVFSLKNLLGLLKENNISFIQAANDEFRDQTEVVNSLTSQVKDLQDKLEAKDKSYVELQNRIESDKQDFEQRVALEVANRIAAMGYRDELPTPEKAKQMTDAEFTNALREIYRRDGYDAAARFTEARERGEV